MTAKRADAVAVIAGSFAHLPHLGAKERTMISLNTSVYGDSVEVNPALHLHQHILQQGVMVVDDSSMHRYSAQLCLRAFGIKLVYEAVNGKLALEQLAQLPQIPAVMLLDVEMPVMDGIEVLQQLAPLPQRPAVVLASSSDHLLIGAVATMAEALGIQLLGAFRKPVDRVDLAKALLTYGTESANYAQPPMAAG